MSTISRANTLESRTFKFFLIKAREDEKQLTVRLRSLLHETAGPGFNALISCPHNLLPFRCLPSKLNPELERFTFCRYYKVYFFIYFIFLIFWARERKRFMLGWCSQKIQEIGHYQPLFRNLAFPYAASRSTTRSSPPEEVAGAKQRRRRRKAAAMALAMLSTAWTQRVCSGGRQRRHHVLHALRLRGGGRLSAPPVC